MARGQAPMGELSLVDGVNGGGPVLQPTTERHVVVNGLAAVGGAAEVSRGVQRVDGGEDTNAASPLDLLYDSLPEDDDDSGGE